MLFHKFILLMAEYTFHLAHETKHKFAPGRPKPLCSLTGLDTLFVSILALLYGNFHSKRDNRLDTCSSAASSAMRKLGKITVGLKSRIAPGESSVCNSGKTFRARASVGYLAVLI
jgi:hypothetical protein